MDTDRDMFVQAFWVKCREVIRPEIDAVATRLEEEGHTVGISSQEYEEAAAAAGGESGPSLTLTVDAPANTPPRNKSGADSSLQFMGDPVRQQIVVRSSGRDDAKPRGSWGALDLAQVDSPTVRAIVQGWL